MKIWQILWQVAWRLLVGTLATGLLLLILVITPIFANLSVYALDLFSKITLNQPQQTPKISMVLGGGLTKKDGKIVLNHYSQSRADTVISLYSNQKNPIITSGAESPWLREYIKSTLPKAVIISDNASMNTCENAIFTAKLMAHHELGDHVFLVTDRYHMARARRQFAKAGIMTTPQAAPLVLPLSWTDVKSNLVHSRRAVYEILALARDIARPQENCRSSDKISIETIETPRKQTKIFY